jgi:preprotein translocase subunit YajC
VQNVSSLIFLVLLIGIFYFMLIRPQKKRVQQHQNLLTSIGVGDEVVTIGGMHGVVRAIGDEDVEIEPAPGVTMRFVKNAIARRITEDLEESEEETTTEETTEPAALETSEDEKS